MPEMSSQMILLELVVFRRINQHRFSHSIFWSVNSSSFFTSFSSSSLIISFTTYKSFITFKMSLVLLGSCNWNGSLCSCETTRFTTRMSSSSKSYIFVHKVNPEALSINNNSLKQAATISLFNALFFLPPSALEVARRPQLYVPKMVN